MALILNGTDGLSDVDGTAATPAIRGTDANTGIFFPAADTIAFSEGGAEVARFDANGRLGLGTTNPAFNFQSVNTSGNSFISAVSSNSTTAGILLGDTDSATVGRVEYNNADNAMLLFTSGSERMRIDSGGRVTTPFQPRVSVNGTQGAYTGGSGAVVPANTTMSGQSNSAGIAAYNTSTYRFTCPTAGIYRVSVFSICQTATSGLIYFRKNGTNFAFSFSQQERLKCGQVIVSCATNDYLDIASDTALYLNSSDPYTQIYYELIG